MDNFTRDRLPTDLRQAARIMSEVGTFETGQGLLVDAADEIERLRYVLAGVRGAIQTGRNEPLVIWKEQIDIALSSESKEQSDG